MFEDKKNFAFDLYGTLIDIKTDENKSVLWSSMANYYSMFGALYTDNDLRLEYSRLCRLETDAIIKKSKKTRYKLDEREAEIDLYNVFAQLFENKGVKADEADVKRAAVTFRSISLEKLRLFPGAINLLETLKARGKKVYLFSNAQELFTIPELHATGLYDYFDDIKISSAIGAKKPSQAFYTAALKGLKASESVMIGNDEFADIRGAMTSGMSACYIQSEQSPSFPRNLPCVQINTLTDLLY